MGSYYVSFRDISNFNSKVETSCEMLSGVPASDVGGGGEETKNGTRTHYLKVAHQYPKEGNR